MTDSKYLPGDIPAVESVDKYHNGLGGDPEMDGLSLYEKKALLVNRELDAHGMGKYQWYIWFLCGFGYMIDLLWAHAFGLVAAPLQQELGFGGRWFPCSSLHAGNGRSQAHLTRRRTREHIRSILVWAHGGGKHVTSTLDSITS